MFYNKTLENIYKLTRNNPMTLFQFFFEFKIKYLENNVKELIEFKSTVEYT